MSSRNTYIALAVIFVASLAAVLVFHRFPVTIVGDLAGVPAIAALFGALFQLSRDRLAFERSVLLEDAKNRFTVGAMSHMAEVAFDKHVLFCEEYIAAAHRATETLLRKGPHPAVLTDVSQLVDIRLKWTVWLQPNVTEALGKFESSLVTIGANAGLLEQLSAGDESRGRALKEAYRTFAQVMGFKEWEGESLTDENTITALIEQLRRVLGIRELTHLRTALISRASRSVE